MEMDSEIRWSEVLLQWVKECGFVKGTYISLEETDIIDFFRNFHSNHRSLQQIESTADLKLFLKVYYPDFVLQTGDQNLISPSEYVYVYSLLLHFACVKQSDAVFRAICRRLPPRSQRCLDSFLNEVIDCTAIDREKMRHAINTVTKEAGAACNNPVPDNLSEDGRSVVGRQLTASFNGACGYSPVNGSPQGNSQCFVPSTSQSSRFEGRRRELDRLQRHEGSGHCDKDLLEREVRQHEKNMQSLIRDYQKLQEEIENLKNGGSRNRSEDEQRKKEIRSEISQKEMEIIKLNETIRTLKEENTSEPKENSANKDTDTYMLRLEELEQKVDEVTAELQKNGNTLKLFKESRNEFDQYENTRDAHMPDNSSNLSIEDANSDPDNFTTSVEVVNHGEKDMDLPKNVNNLNRKASDVIQNYTVKNPQESNVASGFGSLNVREQESNLPNPSERLSHLMERVDRLSFNFQEEKCKVESLLTEVKSKERLSESLGNKLFELEKEVAFLRNHIKKAENLNLELEQNKKSTQEKVESLNDVHILQKQEWAIQCQDYETQITKLKDKLGNREADNATLQSKNEELSNELKALQNKIKEMEEDARSNTDDAILSERIKYYENEIQSFAQSEIAQKEKYEKLKIQYETIKEDRHELADHLETMRNSIGVKEIEMGKIGAEIVEVRSKNVELQKGIDTLTVEFQTQKQKSELAISKRDEHIRQMTDERILLEETLQKVRSDLEKSKNKLKESKDAFLKKLPNIVAHVKTLKEGKGDLERRLELLNKNHSRTVIHSNKMEKELKAIKKAKEDLERNLKHQSEDSEKKLKSLQSQLQLCQEKSTEDTEAILQLNSLENAKYIRQVKAQNEFVLNKLERDLRFARDLIQQKDSELETLIHESSELRQKLDDSAKRLETVQGDYTEMKANSTIKLQQLEVKIEELSNEKKKLKEESDTFKKNHEEISLKLAEADETINELSSQLLQQVENKIQTNAKLESSEMRLRETEDVLENLLKGKSNTINCLRAAYDSQTAVLTEAREQVRAFEMLNSKLEQDLKETVDERDRLTNDVTSLILQVQGEREEKTALLSSLEQTVDKMEEVVAEKKGLEKDYNKLQSKIGETNELCDELKTELNEKDMQLSDLGRMLEEQSVVTESYDTTLLTLTSLLEDHINLRAQAENNDFELEIPENEQDTYFGKLKNALNRFSRSKTMLHANSTLQALTEKLKSLEVNLISSENDFDSLKHTMETLLSKQKELIVENMKYRQNEEGYKKLIERITTKFGDIFVRMFKSEQGNQKLLDERKMLIEKLQQENTTNQTEMYNLRQCLTSAEDLQLNLQSNLHQLENVKTLNEEKIRELTSSLDVAERTNMRLHRENGAIISQMSEFKNTDNEQLDKLIRQHDEALQKMQRETVTKQSEICDLKERLIIAKGLELELNTEVRQLEEANSLLEAEKEKLKLSLQVVESIKEELIIENKKMQKSQADNKKLIERLAIKLGDSQLCCSKNEKGSQKLFDDLKTSKFLVEKLLKENATTQSEVCNLRLCLNSAEGVQRQLQNKLRQLEEVNTSLKEEKAKLEASNIEQIKELNDALDKVKSTNIGLNQEIDALNLQSNILKTTNRERFEKVSRQHEKVLEQLQREVAANQIEISKLKECLVSAKSLESEFNSKVRQLAEANYYLAEENDALKQALQTLEGKKKEFTIEIKQLEETQEANKKLIEALAIKFSETQLGCSKSERDNQKLIVALEMSKTLVERLKQENTISKGEICNLKQNQLELSSQLRQLEESKEWLVKENEQIRKSNEEKLFELNGAFKVARDTNMHQNHEISALTSELAEVKETHTEQLEKLKKQRNDAFEKLQLEKNIIQVEMSTLKERLISAKCLELELTTKCRQLEEDNSLLTGEERRLKEFESDATMKIAVLEKTRISNKEKIQELNSSLERTERINVQMAQEIADINSKLEEMKITHIDIIDKLTKQRDDALVRAAECELLAEKSQADTDTLQGKSTNLGQQLMKVSLALQISQDKYNVLVTELSARDKDLGELKEQKALAENEYSIVAAKLKECEAENLNLLSKNEEIRATLEPQIEQLKSDMNAKMGEISMLQTEKQSLWDSIDSRKNENETLRQRLIAAEAKAESEENTSARLRKDHQLLQEKYQQIKQRMIAATEVSEESIKKMRVEMEEKLDKMKNKMIKRQSLNASSNNWIQRMKNIFGYGITILILLATFLYIFNHYMSGSSAERASFGRKGHSLY